MRKNLRIGGALLLLAVICLEISTLATAIEIQNGNYTIVFDVQNTDTKPVEFQDGNASVVGKILSGKVTGQIAIYRYNNSKPSVNLTADCLEEIEKAYPGKIVDINCSEAKIFGQEVSVCTLLYPFNYMKMSYAQVNLDKEYVVVILLDAENMNLTNLHLYKSNRIKLY